MVALPGVQVDKTTEEVRIPSQPPAGWMFNCPDCKNKEPVVFYNGTPNSHNC